jgi:cytochrome c-type biogenesis protein CcmH/NrfG/predicted aspartyl protease
MLGRLAVTLLGILGPSLAPLAFAEKCKLARILEIPVTMHGLQPMVNVRINDTDTLFLADSGAFYSMITPAAAAELQLKLRPGPFGLVVQGIGGHTRQADIAVVQKITLAGVTFTRPWEFLVGGGEVGDGAAGILGQNILRAGDVEYDLAGGVIRLWKPEGNCRSTNLTYWLQQGQAYSLMDIQWATAVIPHTRGQATLNGTRIQVEFDTGSSTSMLTLRAAARAGIKPDSPGVVFAGMTHGVSRGLVRTWIAPFESFKVGDDEEIRHTRLRFGDFEMGDDAEMLIGADFFLSHRVYVASSQRKLYFTYNGGPVFNLNTNPLQAGSPQSNPPASREPPQHPATETGSGASGGAASGPTDTASPDVPGATAASNTPPPAPPKPGIVPPTGEPTTAEGFSRRGAAFAARRDFVHAIADLTRACELAPRDPEYFYARAQAYVQSEQNKPELARADLEQVLKLKPDHVPALVWRAEWRIREHNEAGALADLDAADHAAAPQADNRLAMGEIYGQERRFAQAIAQYNLWIAVHDDDARVGSAYTGRCRARALLGQELDKALSDCNKALHLNSNNPLALDSRGLVRLRQGDFGRAVSDYSDALKLQPRNPWSLYGRGLAQEHQKNTAAASEGDIAAATALAPHIGDEFKKLGLTP